MYNPDIHHRRSIRLRGHDYGGRGMYFVTLCVKNNRSLFGTVVNGRMALNHIGRITARCWQEIPEHFPYVMLDEWVVMPTHVHGIIHITEKKGGAFFDKPKGEKSFAPTKGLPKGTGRSLGSIVRGFKIGVTKLLDCTSPWQRNYYDIVIRDSHALNNIRRYIRNNPANLDVHRYGEPRFMVGNQDLLHTPLTAFVASRDSRGERFFAQKNNENLTAQNIVDRFFTRIQPKCVVSGFLSPIECAVFNACVVKNIPMIHVLAKGMPPCFPPRIQRVIETGNMLVVTPFDASIDRFNATRAAWCNQYALHLAKNIVVGICTQDGMLACLLAEPLPGKKITCLS